MKTGDAILLVFFLLWLGDNPARWEAAARHFALSYLLAFVCLLLLFGWLRLTKQFPDQ